MIKAYPKIFAIGTDYIRDIFDGPVEVTEKIDGSQFDFCRIDGAIHMRSKGAIIHPENPERMFQNAVDYVMSIQDRIPDGIWFYCEYLKSPKHNVQSYSRVPMNHLALFAVAEKQGTRFNYDLQYYAHTLGIEAVPVLYSGKIHLAQQLFAFLDYESILGGCKIEGVVVKNYAKAFLLGGQPIPVMAGKYVSEAFKEVHRKTWNTENTGKGKWEVFCDGYKTEARWLKSIHRMKEIGALDNSPRDIGLLLKQIRQDILDEETEAIKDFLFQQFSGELLRKSVAGFAEFYKKYLAENSFEPGGKFETRQKSK